MVPSASAEMASRVLFWADQSIVECFGVVVLGMSVLSDRRAMPVREERLGVMTSLRCDWPIRQKFEDEDVY